MHARTGGSRCGCSALLNQAVVVSDVKLLRRGSGATDGSESTPRRDAGRSEPLAGSSVALSA